MLQRPERESLKKYVSIVRLKNKDIARQERREKNIKLSLHVDGCARLRSTRHVTKSRPKRRNYD
jgi:hypothetical protein